MEIYLINGRKLNFLPFFFSINIYFFIKKSYFLKAWIYLYKKGQYEKYYFIYTNYFMHSSIMFNKSTARQNNGLGKNLMDKGTSHFK